MEPEEQLPSNVFRYYVRGTEATFEEDATHEFKGHTNLCVEEVPPWTYIPNSHKRTRAPASRCINAFLNSGKGGTVYLGIIDSGEIKGLNMTQYRKAHMAASLDDLMSRYHPPVERHRYSIEFIPVVEATDTEEERERMATFVLTERELPRQNEPHVLRTHDYCWCFKDSAARYNCGTVALDYVAEITMQPWDPDDSRNLYAVGRMRAPPVHEDEEGRTYFRRQASVVQFTQREMYDMTKQIVRTHYEKLRHRLEEELISLSKGRSGTGPSSTLQGQAGT